MLPRSGSRRRSFVKQGSGGQVDVGIHHSGHVGTQFGGSPRELQMLSRAVFPYELPVVENSGWRGLSVKAAAAEWLSETLRQLLMLLGFFLFCFFCLFVRFFLFLFFL